MDRLNRGLAGYGLVLALTIPGAGCRTTPSEVPPGRPFASDGKPPVGFSQSPNPDPYGAMPPPSNGAGQYGTPAPSQGNSFAPTGNAFGPPGTSVLGPAPAMVPSALTAPSPAAVSAGAALGMPPGASNPSTGIPQAGTGPAPSAAPAGFGVGATAGPVDVAKPDRSGMTNPETGQMKAPTMNLFDQ